jgi:hypothetical protein
MFNQKDEEIFKRAKTVADTLMLYMKKHYETTPAVVLLHALALLYIWHYRNIMLKGTESDKQHAQVSLKSLSQLALEYTEGEEYWAS